MKITREKPEILRFIYRQESVDPHYGSCLWAIFDIDPGRGMLNIQSDCGNYAYRWPERGDSFLKLMCGMEESYLIGKLCGKPQEFDEERTIARISECLNDMEITDGKKRKAIDNLKTTLSGYTLVDAPEVAQFIIDEWNDEEGLEIDCAWELVANKYGAWQKRIVDIFIEHIEPEIKKAIKEGAYHGAEDED